MLYDLTNLIDMHIHTGPDVSPRKADDIEAARVAKDAGMRAILIKSHDTITADRAAIAEKVTGTASHGRYHTGPFAGYRI